MPNATRISVYPGFLEGLFLNENTRSESEAAYPARLFVENRTDLEFGLPDLDSVADLYLQVLKQDLCHHGTLIFEERKFERRSVGKIEIADEREWRLDPFQLDHSNILIRRIHGPGHRRRSDRLIPIFDKRRIVYNRCDLLQVRRREIAGRAYLNVSSHQRPRVRPDRSCDILDQRSQRYDRTDAEGNAKKEKQQPSP